MKNWGIHESRGPLDSGYLPQTDPGLFVQVGHRSMSQAQLFTALSLGRREPVMSRDGHAFPHEESVMKAPESGRSKLKVVAGCHLMLGILGWGLGTLWRQVVGFVETRI